ncbi:MAG: Isoleucine--tRNA ligase [Hyphomicrobiaceae bacterium hypho_1]
MCFLDEVVITNKKREHAMPKQKTESNFPRSETDSDRDWGKTLFLPKTDFPMRAGLPKMEPKMLERWDRIDLYKKLREARAGKARFIVHDGPPYANGNIHIGTSLNKILKDIVVKSQQMLGFDANYIPGWDCHGLPIEWKVEELYRSKGSSKPDFSDLKAVRRFRKECRAFAEHWLDIQRKEFQRLGVIGDWDNPYTTMTYRAEALIAEELMKFALNELLYCGSKPVMWSVVEQTALADAEVEHYEYESDTIYVKFPFVQIGETGKIKNKILDLLNGSSIIIWTTTPWTIPGNRAVCFSSKLSYGVYQVVEASDGNWASVGSKLVVSDNTADDVKSALKVVSWLRLGDVAPNILETSVLAHPLRDSMLDGYKFDVPLFDANHVTDDVGTGFVHTAPGHGSEDFEIWTSNYRQLIKRGIDTSIPFTLGPDGKFTSEAPGFEGGEVITAKGKKGNANKLLIDALVNSNSLVARGRIKHQYPHSWRSKKPVIFRNTPQWFVHMDKVYAFEKRGKKSTLRDLALKSISNTKFVPAAGRNRLRGMIEMRPDWVLSRQRAWGVPITLFVNRNTAEVIPGSKFTYSHELIRRISDSIHRKGADAWFDFGAKERFLSGLVEDPSDWDQVTDILDVWFDSGSTHAFTLEDPKHFPGVSGLIRKDDGGCDTIMYLEGSDQHRGWFQSSLLESCGTRGRAPYDILLTHGFVLDGRGQKMSKSLGNTVSPQEVIDKLGADILRLWVASSDYTNDLRISHEILKTFVETYRKLRNSLRWMVGALHYYDKSHANTVVQSNLPPLERFMLHRLAKLDNEIRRAYNTYEYRNVVSALSGFLNTDLSSFYFDVCKDTLYCDPHSSKKRLAVLHVISEIFDRCVIWLAPILCFTAEEAWLYRYPSNEDSVHLQALPEQRTDWLDQDLAEKFDKVLTVRRVVTRALEIERREKRIGSSLEASPEIYIADPKLFDALSDLNIAEILITSDAKLIRGQAPIGAFTMPDIPGISVVATLASGKKCARSWRIVDDVGTDPNYPNLSARDAAAVREFDSLSINSK